MKQVRKLLTLVVILAALVVSTNAQVYTNPFQKIHLKSGAVAQQHSNQGFSLSGTTQHTGVRSPMVDEWINIGTNSSPWGSYNFPIDMYWNTSLTQSIYTAEEISHEPCAIEKLVYRYKTMTNDYPAVINTEYFRVWMSNTTRESLSQESGYWMPLSDFTLVYEGMIVLYSGEDKEMEIELPAPFTYNGDNLAIMVEHVFSESVFENHFNFEASMLPSGQVRARLYASWENSFNFELPTNDPSQTGMTLGNIADVSLGIITSSDGSLSGTVTNNDGAPISGALVAITGTDLQTHTNASGYYEFPFITTGNYSVRYSAFGYVTAVADLEINTAVVHDVVLDFLPKGVVEGNVSDNDGNVLVGANVQISGYASYSGTTDNDGNFSISDVYYADGYSVAVSKNGYITKIISLSVNEAVVSMGDIHLDDKTEHPSKVTAVKNADNVDITWLSPYERTIYRRDGGDMLTQIGHNFNGESAVFGQVFREPAELYQMSWMTSYVDEPHDFVHVFVFALDASGNPTNTTLYEQSNVPNVDDEWTIFTFPYTIEAENGFMIAVSYPGRIEIGIDSGIDPEYPFMPDANWVSENYSTNIFTRLEDEVGPLPGNLMIRAEGYNTSNGKKLGTKAPTALNTYNIFRLKKGEELTPAAWTSLSQGLTAQNYTDSGLQAADPGWYRYAVTAVYSGGLESEAEFSNVIENALTTSLTFNITTNTGENDVQGAVVKITSTNGLYSYTGTVENENGVLVFETIFKAKYNVLITHEGFNNFIMSNVDLTTNPSYVLDCELIENLAKPFNLQVTVNEDHSALFKWNHTADISEDFEGCTDFEIDPAGVVEWKYLDVDKKTTIGINNFEYPNENQPHAFMIFNPSQTNPPIDLELNATIAPFSGDKFLASFAPVYGNNDDYFISPKLNFGQDFTVRFRAKSFSTYPVPNKIMVGYSTTGYQPEDFTWLTQDPIELPEDRWNKYEYELGEEVRYVAIHNVSDGGYILMIDNVDIVASSAAKSRALNNFEVYLNGKSMGLTTELTWNFEAGDLIQGEMNLAGVKAIYSSGESEIATIEFMVHGGVDASQDLFRKDLKVYPNPSNGVFTISLDGTYEVSVINMAGTVVFNTRANGEQMINLGSIEPGIYVISAKSADRIMHQAIVIK